MKRAVSSIGVFALLSFGTAVSAYENFTPQEAYYEAVDEPHTYILDVRTAAEWTWVGHPGENKSGDGADLKEKVVNISVKVERRNELIDNPFFVWSVKKAFPDKEGVRLITMCRSGGRSVEAAEALEAAGYTDVGNMLTGFEGGKDGNGYRTVNGWKVDGLPYNNSREGSYTFWRRK